MQQSIDDQHLKTRFAFMVTRLLQIPFWGIFNMLPFILYKDLHATPLQITVMICLKPAVSLISLYWSASVHKRRDRLLSNLIWGNILRHLPFLFYPFIDNVWFFVFSFGFYMTLHRGVIPAWMEVLKINIPGVKREKVFAYGSSLDYLGAAILPLLFGWLLDDFGSAWRFVFFASAVIGILSTFFLSKIPIDQAPQEGDQDNENISWKTPWVNAWNLLKARPDFARFQLGFMLGGGGLMIMQTTLPEFFIDVLNLSYKELALALTVCKGAGYALSSPLWALRFSRMDIYRFSGFVTLVASLFPACLMLAQWNLLWLYFGYIAYGIMQAGSEMSWNISGPIFSKDHDSSLYSSVNVLTVGMRGCFVPAIGSVIYQTSGASSVMVAGAILCALATERMLHYSRKGYLEPKTI